MKDLKSSSENRFNRIEKSKRRFIRNGVIGGVATAVWHKPIINTVVLPAHAQTSDFVQEITVSSLDANNPFARFVLIVDQNDNVLANCGASGGTATASNLPAGNYRVFADSNGSQTQIIDITAGANSTRVEVPTNTGSCNFLVATIELPAGQITPQNGQTVAGPWSCSSNLNTGCS